MSFHKGSFGDESYADSVDFTERTSATSLGSCSNYSIASSLADYNYHYDFYGGDGGSNAETSCYGPTASPVAQKALEILQDRLSSSKRYAHICATSNLELRLESMKESFDKDVLTQFYEELMIPNFPLEEERDDLEDWLLILDPSLAADLSSEDGPSMDVLILRSVDHSNGDSTIIGGIAFEYYPSAQAGLLSYMVVSPDFRRLGILAALHPVFCHALQSLHQVSSRTNSPIRAILAETNTIMAGDVPPAVAKKRHEILFKLGYRLLEFPYVQPPLSPDVDSFDDIMLLIYVGNGNGPTTSTSVISNAITNNNLTSFDESASNENKDATTTTTTTTTMTTIPTQVLFDYVLDFYHSVFGCDSLDFQDHWYYRLVTWYAKRYPTTRIQMDLPWEDVTPILNQVMLQEEEELQQQQQQQQQQPQHTNLQEEPQNQTSIATATRAWCYDL